MALVCGHVVGGKHLLASKIMKNFLERTTDIKNSSSNFKFYVSADQEVQDLNQSSEDICLEKAKPKLLDHEIIIAEGNKVLFFPNVADKTKGLLGNLYVTNFRFIFSAYEEENFNEVEHLYQRNHLLGEHGSCLSNVESLYQICGEKKRKLCLKIDSQLTGKVKGLQIFCKNLKVFTFNFDQSPITQGKTIAKTLLHHAFPGRHHLLFAYDYSPANVSLEKQPEEVVLYSKKSEWENELSRTCSTSASKWRISTQNQRYQMSTSLPKWLIVPHSVLDCDFVTASQSFRCNRPPIWTWSSPNGAALVRMADLLPTITDRTQENRMLEYIRKCHPHLKGPCIKYLDKDLPSVSELYQSYSKFKSLCTPDSCREFKQQDARLYSVLENTKWLQYVSLCLRVVTEAAQEIQRGITVVLQESDGRDTSAVISSLVQLVLDPRTRSIIGFQSLIQKEWIALGHPFCTRLGHVKTNNSEQSPVFLFFLDCVWQLQNQFPSSFEFTETYLTTLWDSVHISLFDTFLFDCEKERSDALANQTERLIPRSVWDWSFQFSERDIDLFVNPLYKFSQLENFFLGRKEKAFKSESSLLPNHSLPYIELWTQCYFRWLPLLSIKSGGRPQVDIIHRQLLKDIQTLLIDVKSYSKKIDANDIYVASDCDNSNDNSSQANDTKINLGKNSAVINRKNNCSIGGASTGDNNQNFSDGSRLHSKDFNNETFYVKDVTALFQNKDIIDNFFPFAVGSTTFVSSLLADSSNISEFDTQSVLNLTD